MTAKLISNENGKAVYTIELDWSALEPATEEAYKRLRGRYPVHGFRKGKAPRKVIEANYGQGVFFEEALNQLLPEEVKKASEALELEPVGQPDISIKEMEQDKPIVLEITTDLLPHPELGDLSEIKVVDHPHEVSEEQVDRVIQAEQEKNAVLEPVEDRPVQKGDQAKIDYEGFVDGVPFEGGKGEGYDLEIGSGTFIPGFEDQIIGHQVGDAFDVEVTFPEDYHAEELSGKEAIFKTKLHEIHEKKLPELDDDFAQDVSEYDTLEAYRKSVREDLEKRAEEAHQADQENQAVQGLIDCSKFDLPESMIDEQVEIEVRNMANQIGQMGLTLDQYFQYTGGNLDAFRKQQRPMATLRLSGDLVLEALADQEKMEVSDEELDQELQKLAEQYGGDQPEAFVKKVKDLGNDAMVRDDVKKKKAIAFLMSKVQHIREDEAAEQKAEDEAQEASKEDQE